MDEAVAGHATRIEVTLEPGNRLTITDNGRGIPVDPHPKFPGKSALEVIMSTLHSGGKFEGKAYATSGGLHGVGISVVNALSETTVVEVARNKELFRQSFSRGITLGPLEKLGPTQNRRGTSVSFIPDGEIFGPEMHFKPARLHKLARSKAYLFAGVEIRWKCAPELISDETPAEAVFQFPGGLADHLREQVGERECATAEFFSGSQDFPDAAGRVEWAVAWPLWSEGSYSWYCNTIPTPDGGTHEAGLRTAIVKGIRAFGALIGQKKADSITADDIIAGSEIMLSVFVRDPQFQSQTKDRLTSPEAARPVENPWRSRSNINPATVVSTGYNMLQIKHTTPPTIITGFRPIMSVNFPLKGREAIAVSVNNEIINPLYCSPPNRVKNSGSSGMSILKLAKKRMVLTHKSQK